MGQQSKEKIVESAIKVLFRNPQYTMDQLADKLGISRATLYRYFNTKQMLLKEITVTANHFFKETFRNATDNELPVTEKLSIFIRDFVTAGATFYFLAYNDLFLKDPEVQILYKEQTKTLEMFCSMLKDNGLIDIFVPNEWFASALEYLMYAAWERVHQGDLAVNKAPDLVLNTLLWGLSVKKKEVNK